MSCSEDSPLHRPTSERVRVRRRPNRASYDPKLIESILDAGFIAHIGFVADDQPFVIPTTYVRIHRRVFFHGAAANRTLCCAASGVVVCFSVTLLDGLVLARSAFHHSMNYRSVVILGRAELVENAEQKLIALNALVDRFAKGRSREVRGPNPKELNATSVLALPIDEASAKIRTGPPLDDEADLDVPCWSGVIPLAIVAGEPRADTDSTSERKPPKLAAPLTAEVTRP